MYELILPLGIINFLLVLVQILGGLKIIKISYKTHKFLGITLGVFALIHGAIAIFFT
ncbi:MAG: hypothetical protein MUF36_02310 [Bacteroidales bacterium]|jgi:hypothetical protein|nr:hypothetical protein [Bacteroidales bacterium]